MARICYKCLLLLLVSLAIATPARAQGRGCAYEASYVIGVAYNPDSTDENTIRITTRVNTQLRKLARTPSMHVLSRRDFESAEVPEYHPWDDWHYYEIAKLLRADVIYDVKALHGEPNVVARVLRHRAAILRPDTLRLAEGATVERVADIIADTLYESATYASTAKMERCQREALQRTCVLSADQPYLEFQVDARATYINDERVHPRPAPDSVRTSSGTVVTFVVDTIGVPEVTTLKVIRSGSSDAGAKARAAAGNWRFTPARVGRCKVPQMLQTELLP